MAICAKVIVRRCDQSIHELKVGCGDQIYEYDMVERVYHTSDKDGHDHRSVSAGKDLFLVLYVSQALTCTIISSSKPNNALITHA